MFVGVSLSTSLLALFDPTLLPAQYAIGEGAVFFVLIFGSWYLFGRSNDVSHSECFLTGWENHFRKKEYPGTEYTLPCISHYALRWFGWQVRRKTADRIIMLFIALPIVAGIVELVV